MAPSAALIIATAALTAVILQAILARTPETAVSSSSGHLGTSAPTGAGASASAIANFVPHESRDAVPHGWANLGAATDSTPMTLRVALHSKDVAGLQQAVLAVSTPGNAKYGQHLNTAQVKEYMAPSAQTVKAVTDYFASEGVSAQPMAGHGDWIGFDTTVAQAGRLFNASFSTYHHVNTGTQHVRTMAYSVPAHLKEHIELVHPMTTFSAKASRGAAFSVPDPVPRRSSPRQAQNCGDLVTPACLQELYGLPSDPATQSGNSMVVTGYSQVSQDADTKVFLQTFRPDIAPDTVPSVQLLDDGNDTQNATAAATDLEANLDIQYTLGIATDVAITFLSVGSANTDGALGFLDTIDFLSALDTPPTVITTSYDLEEDTLSPALLVKMCNAYGALGARGVSILFSSGDHGVAGAGERTCIGKPFVPTFPPTCPYVTSVGATQGLPEVPMVQTGDSPDFSSSGGFSNVFPIPDWQASVVESYLSTLGNTNAGLFNASGRGFPDIAAYGHNAQIFVGGAQSPVDGTSISSPIFASVIALVNDKLLAAGKPVLGFLNPWLYANPGALNDITTGNNLGCGTNGFPAVTGWDPVTGLGTPIFASLLTAAGL